MMKRILGSLLGCLIATAAFGQAQVGSGNVLGNTTASRAPAADSSVTLILDRALGSTRGSILERGASGWAIVGPGTTGKPWVSAGAGADPSYATLGIVGGGTNCAAASGTCLDNITGFSSTGIISRTGAGTYAFNVLGGVTMALGSDATGDIYYNSGGILTRLAIGSATTLLHGGASIPAYSQVVYADIAAAALATAANLEAGTASKLVPADVIYDAEKTVTFAASQTLDFGTFLNARITATANTTSLTCTGMKPSQSGVITWVQDGTGSRTMVAGWCSQFRWANGARGVLSTAINAVDALFYQCISTSVCYVSLGKAQAN